MLRMFKSLLAWFKSKKTLIKTTELLGETIDLQNEALRLAILTQANAALEWERKLSLNAQIIAALLFYCGGDVILSKDLVDLVSTGEHVSEFVKLEDGSVKVYIMESEDGGDVAFEDEEGEQEEIA